MTTAQSPGNTTTRPQADDIAGVNELYAGGGQTDAAGPALSITSHTNGQTVSTATVTLSGTASDAGRGDNGISSATVNGVRAVNDSVTGASTASWARTLTLNPGANTLTVIATDASSSLNTTTATIVTVADQNRYLEHLSCLSTVCRRPARRRLHRTTLVISNPSSAAAVLRRSTAGLDCTRLWTYLCTQPERMGDRYDNGTQISIRLRNASMFRGVEAQFCVLVLSPEWDQDI
jgi:hypothetical protein